MKATRWVVLLVAVALVAGANPTGAAVWENVTVITTDGWEYPGTTVESAAGETFIILIDGHGGRKRIARSKIRVIRDAKGADITATVYSGQGGTPGATLPEPGADPDASAPTPEAGAGAAGAKTSPKAREVGGAATLEDAAIETEQEASGRETKSQRDRRLRRGSGEQRPYGPRFRFSVAAGGGIGTAAGDWYEGITSGPSINIDVRVAINEQAYFGVNFTRQSLGIESEFERITVLDESGFPVTVDVEWDIDFKEYYVYGAAMTDPYKYTSPVGYFEAGLGAVDQKIELSVTGFSGVGRDSEMGFALYSAAGGMIPFGRHAGVDLQANMRWVDGESDLVGFLFGARASLIVFMGN